MITKTMCILFSESYSAASNELAEGRTLATVPFGGRYRLIDFALSSLVKAQVANIGVVTKDNYGSLVDHLGSGRDWDLARRKGGLKILTPFVKPENAISRNRSKIDALLSCRMYLEENNEEYVILADTNVVMNIDFRAMVEYHAEKGADITLVYQNINDPAYNGMVVDCDRNSQVIDAYYSASEASESKSALLKVFIFNKSLLLSLLDRAYTFGWTDFDRDFITKNIAKLNIFGYEHKGYAAVINTITDYYTASMELIGSADIRNELFNSDTPLLTRVKNSPPTIYGFGGKVHNSLIADGCVIDGEVNNCIIFRDVEIKKGAVLNNCIIIQGSVIEPGAQLNCVIADKNVVVEAEHTLSGYPTYPFVISKGQRV
ncbi:MAG: glucose-1-phosphate adenylyltransferase subunit GlgD [Oscillospiraceae bacterium]|jgi:glucose-1-phosphate adenylyltransferase|nr:glucose-1-phosphate adenylyltransferase subunit GlgD [Oscillospiraceae bacterium]